MKDLKSNNEVEDDGFITLYPRFDKKLTNLIEINETIDKTWKPMTKRRSRGRNHV